jgi:protein-S-isoprenylcysteine O-methyltransferase Ste14
MKKTVQDAPGAAKAREASRAAPAPVIFVVALVVGILLHLAFPVPFLPRIVTLLAGAACFLLPFPLGFAALRAMRHANTSVNPKKPTTVLLTEGLFRYTRNPMYLAMGIQYVGLALLFNALWAIVLLPCALIVVHFTVIRREEQYLERTFGEPYLSYTARVRRWL